MSWNKDERREAEKTERIRWRIEERKKIGEKENKERKRWRRVERDKQRRERRSKKKKKVEKRGKRETERREGELREIEQKEEEEDRNLSTGKTRMVFVIYKLHERNIHISHR